jgi:hypothetical protein
LWRSFGRRLRSGLEDILDGEALGLQMGLQKPIEIGHVTEGSEKGERRRKSGNGKGQFSFEATVSREVRFDLQCHSILRVSDRIKDNPTDPTVDTGNREPMCGRKRGLDLNPHICITDRESSRRGERRANIGKLFQE